MIQIAIVEDEALYAQQIEQYLERYQIERNKEINITVFSDGEDIVENYKSEYDIILMDIQMKFMDGMTAAEKIRKLDQSVVLMFITNMTQYAVRGYEVDAMDYILKPVEYFAFSQKLDKAIEKIKKKDEVFISIPVDEGILKLNVLSIYYIESQGHIVVYKTDKGEYTSRITLKELEGILEKYGFYRCSKSFLVNMAKVDGLLSGECLIRNERIPVGRNKRKEFMDKLLTYINS